MFVRLAKNLFKTSDFIQCQKLIVAVSGGSDSLALLFLVKDYLTTLSVPPEMIVVSVDHRLRRESAREVEDVAEICRAHHIRHVTLRWDGEKPKTHIAEKARVARYNLLFQEAQKQGATLIMTGHTLNDQVETYQMRSQRISKNVDALQQTIFGDLQGEGCAAKMTANIAEMTGKNCILVRERGLSCIPREALLRQKVRLIRPLLGVKRKTLRAYLRLQGKTWIDDPTNEDLNFERVRVRQSLPQKKIANIAKKVNEAALKRRRQAQNIADLILALDIAVEHGRCFIEKPVPFLHQHPDFPFVVGLFAVLMGGSSYLLPYKKLTTLAQKLCLSSPKKQRFTLAGSVIECSISGVAFWRESRNIKEAIVAPKKTVLWDGRYQITNHTSNAITVKPADLEHLKSLCQMESQMEFLCQNSICDCKHPHFPSLQSLPMILKDKEVNIPELTYQCAFEQKALFQQNVLIKRILAPFDWLLSCEDAALVHTIEPFFNVEIRI
ncbi:tRNA lysidine(34) synthetase TilS [Bartonella sp. CB74]|uniref:tRNA lysidine(34) synthetase TilS n=1 Tax=Bartonella sp. CB74 TaxID=3113620 RepID=UPI002F9622AA